VPRISEATRDERRQHFVEAAWRCAARKGYRDTTVDDICAETGLSKGAFYGYFDSKQALLLALLEDDADAIDAVLDDSEAKEVGTAERLRLFTRAMLALGEDPAHVQVRADLWTAMMTDRTVRDRFVETIQRRRQRLRGWIETGIADGELEAIPANAFASLLLALADGLLLHGGLDASGFRWANIRKAVDILLSGMVRTRAPAVHLRAQRQVDSTRR